MKMPSRIRPPHGCHKRQGKDADDIVAAPHTGQGAGHSKQEVAVKSKANGS